jgi:thioredoxin-like negative regulator of GroEL
MVIKPSLEMVKEEFEDKVEWVSVNTKEDPNDYVRTFGVSIVPTIIVLKGSTEIGRYSGTQIAIIYQLIRKGLAA